MFFDSTVYLVFLVLVTVLYWRLRFRAQNCFLLLASYFFYGCWAWRFLLLMGTSTGGDFFVARGLDAFSQLRQRRASRITVRCSPTPRSAATSADRVSWPWYWVPWRFRGRFAATSAATAASRAAAPSGSAFTSSCTSGMRNWPRVCRTSGGAGT